MFFLDETILKMGSRQVVALTFLMSSTKGSIAWHELQKATPFECSMPTAVLRRMAGIGSTPTPRKRIHFEFRSVRRPRRLTKVYTICP